MEDDKQPCYINDGSSITSIMKDDKKRMRYKSKVLYSDADPCLIYQYNTAVQVLKSP